MYERSLSLCDIKSCSIRCANLYVTLSTFRAFCVTVSTLLCHSVDFLCNSVGSLCLPVGSPCDSVDSLLDLVDLVVRLRGFIMSL